MEEEQIFKDELSEKILLNRRSISLSITRIPKPTLQWFLNESENNFCGDRGMLLKHLVDFYNGECSSGHEGLISAIEQLRQEVDSQRAIINALTEQEEEPPKRKSLSKFSRQELMEMKKNG